MISRYVIGIMAFAVGALSAADAQAGPFTLYSAQITMTGTAVSFTIATGASSGITCVAVTAGGRQVSIGTSMVTNPQQYPFSGGSAIGIYLRNGQSISLPVTSGMLYVNGTMNDGVQCGGF